MNTDLIAIIVAAIGAGGIGSAIVNGLFGKKKNDAETFRAITESLAATSKALMELAESRIISLTQRTVSLESRIDMLETVSRELRSSLTDREQTIQMLQKENLDLQNQVDQLKRENKSKDLKIEELSHKLQELAARLNAMTSGECNDEPGT